MALAPGTKLGPYEILAPIGAGGMGEVYRAKDHKLGREVAVKVLPKAFSKYQERVSRFTREARLLALLNHPNILDIHDLGEEGGHFYAVMELLEGENLREVLSEGALPPRRAIDYAKQIAEGMAAAQEKGIVHRDLKPPNIFVTNEGRVKILDFGLAKQGFLADETPVDTPTQTRPTRPGVVLGTVGYMSPEQVKGKEADHRSDIFAFGTVLYEMLSGKCAFRAASEAETLSAILRDEPPSLTDLNPSVPPALDRIVRRCMEKNPAERFQSARDISFALDAISDMPLAETTPSGSVTEMPPEGESVDKPKPSRMSSGSIIQSVMRSPVRSTLIGLSILAVVTLVVWMLRPSPLLGFQERDWVLIADFEHPEGEAELGRALTLALDVGLQQSGYINVVSRSRVQSALKMMELPPDTSIDESTGRTICQRLGAKALLAPEVASVAGEYLMTLRLVEPTRGDSVASFAERAQNEGEILDSLEMLIGKLRSGLGESLLAMRQGKPLDDVTTGSLEALKRFTDGNLAWNQGRYEEAVTFFEDAVELDPDFAFAYCSLGNAYASYLFNERDKAKKNFEEALSRLDRVGPHERNFIQAQYHGYFGTPEDAIRYYRLHVQSYPDDLGARYNLGNNYRDIGDCQRAMREYEEVLRIDPQHANSLINLATCLGTEKQFSDSVDTYRRAFEVRPEWEISGNLNHEYGMTLVAAERLEEARAVFDRRLAQSDEGERGSAHRSLGQLALYQGQFDKAAEHFDEAASLHVSVGWPTSAGRDRLFGAIGEAARGHDEVAAQALDLAAKEVPLKSGWIWLRSSVGNAYVDAGRLEAARALSSELDTWAADNEKPGEDSLQRRLILGARLATADNDTGRALEILGPLRTSKRGKNVFLNWVLAETYIAAGRWDEAETALLAVVEHGWIGYEGLVPWILAHYELAQVYEHLERADEVARYCQRFVDLWGNADTTLPEVEAARQRLRDVSAK